jgi:hypothetical protein
MALWRMRAGITIPVSAAERGPLSSLAKDRNVRRRHQPSEGISTPAYGASRTPSSRAADRISLGKSGLTAHKFGVT